MRDSFIFYRSFYECVSELPDENRLELYEAIFRFALNGEEPNIEGISLALFKAFKPQIIANYRKYENGCKSKKSKGEANGSKPKAKQSKPKANGSKTEANQSKHQPNDNVNDNDNDNENGNENGPGFDKRNTDGFPALLSFMNSQTGATFSETEQFDDLIRALLAKGYTEQDIRTVIRKKSLEWSCDGKMRSLLRPSVLFGDKFEEYLNAPEPIEVEEEEKKIKEVQRLQTDLDDREAELESVNERIQQIRTEDSVSENYDELNDLKLRSAILEDGIESIRRRLGGAT